MNTLKRSWSGRMIVLALAVLLAGFPLAMRVSAEEEGDASVCEQAALKCIAEAVFAGLFSGGASLPIYLGFCMTGYAFCEKYVDKYIRG